MLQFFTVLFVQDDRSVALLEQLDLPTARIVRAGDTRVDRVTDIVAAKKAFPLVEKFAGNAPILVAGSTWSPDLECLSSLYRHESFAGWRMIVAPHEIDEDSLRRTEAAFPAGSTVRLSQIASESNATVLIIDNIGMLSSLYRYGRVAYVGGAFGSGLHNILEPAAHGLPVLFGPKYRKFNEATALTERGGAVAVSDGPELIAAFVRWQEERAYHRATTEVATYLREQRGATRTIVRTLLDEPVTDL